jgi:hypothetical protein
MPQGYDTQEISAVKVKVENQAISYQKLIIKSADVGWSPPANQLEEVFVRCSSILRHGYIIRDQDGIKV